MDSLYTHLLYKKFKKVKTVCEPLKKLQITGFIYMRRYPDGRFIDLSNQIEWAVFFLEKYLEARYPVESITHHMLSERGILLWCTDPHNVVWQEGEKYFGFGNGISIYKNNTHYCEIFCFYGDIANKNLSKHLGQSLPVLEKFIRYFLTNMEQDIIMAYENNDFLFTPNQYMEHNQNTTLDEQDFVDALTTCKKKNGFSQREKECILLSSCGKTAKEIARHMNLSPRTVETHLANAKQKVGCKNIKDLIYKFSEEKNHFLASDYWALSPSVTLDLR